MSSQYCKPSGSDPVWRCPVCGQWWQLDLPDGDFWEPISTLKAFLQFHPKWKAERKHRKAMDDSEREWWVNLAASAWTLIDGTEETE